MKPRSQRCALAAALGLALLSAAQAHVKNVIVMISDGCGFNQIAATSLWQYGKLGCQPYQGPGFYPLAVSTYSAGGKGYQPARAWSDPTYVKSGPTDSAAAATALSTGVKTYDAAIGVGLDKQPLKHLAEWAKELGKSTGVVTTVPLSHATPAGFVAHNANRNNYAEIANDMLLRSRADVVVGACHPFFDVNGEPRAKPDYKYVGGEATWQALQAGKAGNDADGDGRPDAWTLLETRTQFEQLAAGTLQPRRVVGVAQVAETLQEKRAAGRPQNSGVPDLPTIATGALQVLGRNPRGLFLMIEGGAIDWAGHENKLDRQVEEESDFNRAVQAVMDWVQVHSNWDETLLIVTGDHETGYLTAPTAPAPPDASLPLPNLGAGQLPGHQWNTGGHTNSLIPLFARGYHAERFLQLANRCDPVRGAYCDNTDVPRVVREAFGVELARQPGTVLRGTR